MNKEQRDAVQQMVDALADLRQVCAETQSLQGREYVDLGIQVNKALATGRALLSDAAPQEPKSKPWGWSEDGGASFYKSLLPARDRFEELWAAFDAATQQAIAAIALERLAAAPAAQPATPDAGYVPLTDEDIEPLFREAKAMPLKPGHSKDEWFWFAWGAELAEREVLSRVQAVRKPLTEDARDAARLDWIARQDLDDLAFGLVQDAPHDGEYAINVGNGPFYGRTLRAAIDAAMQGEQQ